MKWNGTGRIRIRNTYMLNVSEVSAYFLNLYSSSNWRLFLTYSVCNIWLGLLPCNPNMREKKNIVKLLLITVFGYDKKITRLCWGVANILVTAPGYSNHHFPIKGIHIRNVQLYKCKPESHDSFAAPQHYYKIAVKVVPLYCDIFTHICAYTFSTSWTIYNFDRQVTKIWTPSDSFEKFQFLIKILPRSN